MKCNVCHAPRPKNPWVCGIIFNIDGITPLAIAYLCVPPCTNNRHIWWAEATEQERQQAQLAQQSRDAASEMAFR